MNIHVDGEAGTSFFVLEMEPRRKFILVKTGHLHFHLAEKLHTCAQKKEESM